MLYRNSTRILKRFIFRYEKTVHKIKMFNLTEYGSIFVKDNFLDSSKFSTILFANLYRRAFCVLHTFVMKKRNCADC